MNSLSMAERIGGGIKWHACVAVFECLGCGELFAMRRRGAQNPEAVATVREMLVLDHTECWEYDDPRMAKLQRRFRKGVKRQKLLMGRKTNDRMGTVDAVGVRVPGANATSAEGRRGQGV
jgi:hypothetical protein